ncbi:MAG TPA: hypothetical protein V6D34_14090 [Candidatus Sericytochromatia bacterium]
MTELACVVCDVGILGVADVRLLMGDRSSSRFDHFPVDSVKRFLALLNPGMNRPHPRPFSSGRRALELLFPLLWGEG